MMQEDQVKKRFKICPLCREKMTSLYNSKRKVAYYECPNCGYLFSAKKVIIL